MCKGLAALPATCLKSAKDIKHRIGYLLQKPDPLPEQRTQRETDKAAAPKKITPVETEKWKTSFSSMINNDVGRAAFTSFLRSEFSQENMEFWLACEEYKKTPTDKMDVKAREIFELYMDADSPNEVNLDSATREETLRNLEKCDISCFDEAQSKIFTLMEKDSYRRFLKSTLLQELSKAPVENLDKRGKRNHAGHAHLQPRCN